MTTLREAAQQALEALETVWPIIEGEKFKHECSYGGNFSKSKTDRARKACVESLAAIAALRAALAQQANHLTIERLRVALVASRIIPPAAVEDPDEYDDGLTLFRIEALHRRLT